MRKKAWLAWALKTLTWYDGQVITVIFVYMDPALALSDLLNECAVNGVANHQLTAKEMWSIIVLTCLHVLPNI
jgi:hypothetical protein